MNPPTRASRWFGLAIAGLLLIGYALLARVNAQAEGFLVNDQGSKYLEIEALISSGWQNLFIEYPGRDLDPAGAFSPLRQHVFVRSGSQFISIYLTPYLLLVSGLYAALGSYGLYIVSVISGAALVWLTGTLGRPVVARRNEPLALMAIGVASPLLFYSTEFWEHAAAALLAVAGLGLFLSSRKWGWLWSGVCWGLGAACRPEVVLFGAAACAATVTLRTKGSITRSARALLATLAVLLPVGVYYRLATGSWLGPQFLVNYTQRGNVSTDWLQTWLAAWPVRLQMLLPASQAVLWMLALGLLFVLAVRLSRRQAGHFLWGIGYVWAAAVSVLALVAVSQGAYPDDVVTSFPVAAFIAVSWLEPRRAETDGLLNLWERTIAFFIPLALLIAPNAGGRQWGPRYLLPIFPLLALLAVQALERFRDGPAWLRSTGLAALAVSLAVGAGIQTVGLLVSVGRAGNTALVQAVRATPEPIILAEDDYVPMLAARTFHDKLWFLAEETDDLASLLSAMRRQTSGRLASIVRVERQDPMAGRLKAEGCRLEGVTDIASARPALVMIHATCMTGGAP